MTTKPRTLHEMEQFVIDQFKAHWFTQGGTARFGAIDGTNADELVASILAALLEAVPQVEENKEDHGAALLRVDPSAPPATTEALPNPPQGAIDIAVQMSTYSPCQSKRGAVVFGERGGAIHILGRGYNHKTKFECDGSATCKATCRKDAIHAEQMALINAAKTGFIVGMEALHVKTVDGSLVPSGGPSCVECSKLLRAIGVSAVWLYHAAGWQRYGMDEFHALSLIGSGNQDSSAEPAVERTGAQREDPTNTSEAVPHLDDHEKNDHGGTRLTAVAAVSVSEADQLTHAVNDKLIALYDAIARTAGVTREIAVAETGYFVHALVQAIINQAGSVSVVEGDSDRPQRAGAQAPKSNSSNCPATPEGSRDDS